MSDNKMTAEQALERFRQDLLPDPHDERDIDASWIRRRWEKYEPIIRQALSAPRGPDIVYPDAMKASIKMLRSKFHGARCDSDGVSGCVHCNVMFLCAQAEKLLTASPEPVAERPIEQLCKHCGGETMHVGDVCYSCSHPPEQVEPSDKRPANCRERLREEGKAYPRTGCLGCGSSFSNGGLRPCPYAEGNSEPVSPYQQLIADLRAEVDALKAKLATAGADALDKAADEYAAEAGELLLEKSGWKPVTGTWLRSLADKLREKASRLREGDPS